jgi:hypothetical protein
MRSRKDRQVDVIRHKNGMSIPLMFDPNPRGDYGLTFSASVGDRTFRNADASVVRREVREYLNASTNLQWTPVITLCMPQCHTSGTSIHLDVHRLYLAVDHSGRMRRLEWDDHEESNPLGFSREAYLGIKSLEELPCQTRDTHVLPYDPALWAGLTEVENQLQLLAARLAHLIAHDRAKLTLLGQRLKLLEA